MADIIPVSYSPGLSCGEVYYRSSSSSNNIAPSMKLLEQRPLTAQTHFETEFIGLSGTLDSVENHTGNQFEKVQCSNRKFGNIRNGIFVKIGFTV